MLSTPDEGMDKVPVQTCVSARFENGYGWWWYKRALEVNRLSALLVLGCDPVDRCDAAGCDGFLSFRCSYELALAANRRHDAGGC